LFPLIGKGVRVGGLFAAALPMVDPRPSRTPMNPA